MKPESLRKDDVAEIQEIFKIIVMTEPSRFEMLESQTLPSRNADWRGAYWFTPRARRYPPKSQSSSPEGRVKEARFGDWQTGEVAFKTQRLNAHV